MQNNTLCNAFITGVCFFLISGCVSVQSTTTRAINEPAAARANAATNNAAPVSAEPAGQSIPDAPNRADILATIDRFFEALATRDADTLEAIVSQNAIDVTTYPEREGQPVRYGKTADVIASMRAGDLPKIEEPYWDPIVLQRKTIAVVWTPYEVWVDETLSHCGIDVFNLTRQNGAWIIDSIHWTSEPSACEELWPDGRSQLRPNMFSKGM